MAGRQSEAERLRQCRLLFEQASAQNVTLQEARRRAAQVRWQESITRLDARRAANEAERDPTPVRPWMYDQ